MESQEGQVNLLIALPTKIVKEMERKGENSQRKSSHERGAVFIVALMLVVATLILAIPFLFKLSGRYRVSEKSFKTLEALNSAEAGIERAIWELNQRRPLSEEWVETEDGVLTLTIDDFSASDETVIGDIEISILPPVGEIRVVKATGRVPYIDSRTVDRTVQVNLKMHYDSIFGFAVFAEEGIHMNSNATVDSYNSNLGLYQDQERGSQGHTGTNNTQAGSIVLDSNARIFGNVASGVGTPEDELDEVIDSNAANTYIEGKKYSLVDPFVMSYDSPLEDIIESLENKGDFITDKGESITLTENNSGMYSAFILDTGTTVTIEGNVTLYVTGAAGGAGEFLMENNSILEIADDGNSSLTLVLGKTTFYQKSNSDVNNSTKIPANLLILGTNEFDSEVVGEMHWNSNTELYGVIFVPKADLHYDSNHDLYGSVICHYLDFSSNSSVHYDEALRQLDTFSGGIPYYVVKSWQEAR